MNKFLVKIFELFVTFIIATLIFIGAVAGAAALAKIPINSLTLKFVGLLYLIYILIIILWNLNSKLSTICFIVGGIMLILFALTDSQDLIHKISELTFGGLCLIFAYTTTKELNSKETN